MEELTIANAHLRKEENNEHKKKQRRVSCSSNRISINSPSILREKRESLIIVKKALSKSLKGSYFKKMMRGNNRFDIYDLVVLRKQMDGDRSVRNSMRRLSKF